MELDIGQIMEILPHRQPFLLIDTVEELESGVRAVAKKCVSYNEPFFGGHFPNEPVMPGVLIIEALAQTGAVAILSVEENRGKTAYFAGIFATPAHGKCGALAWCTNKNGRRIFCCFVQNTEEILCALARRTG